MCGETDADVLVIHPLEAEGVYRTLQILSAAGWDEQHKIVCLNCKTKLKKSK